MSAEADAAVRRSIYAKLNDAEFYRGLADAVVNGSALVFASDEQLKVLRSATEVCFDATFKVVPTICYQLFTCVCPLRRRSIPGCVRPNVAQDAGTVHESIREYARAGARLYSAQCNGGLRGGIRISIPVGIRMC